MIKNGIKYNTALKLSNEKMNTVSTANLLNNNIVLILNILYRKANSLTIMKNAIIYAPICPNGQICD